MKPTDEERREVARRLRDEGLYASLIPRDQFFRWMFNVVDSPKTVASMTMRLADLIEPAPERTCRNEADALNEREGFETYGFVCSECGYNELKKDADRVLCLRLFDLNYCRMCGARVEGAAK